MYLLVLTMLRGLDDSNISNLKGRGGIQLLLLFFLSSRILVKLPDELGFRSTHCGNSQHELSVYLEMLTSIRRSMYGFPHCSLYAIGFFDHRKCIRQTTEHLIMFQARFLSDLSQCWFIRKKISFDFYTNLYGKKIFVQHKSGV